MALKAAAFFDDGILQSTMYFIQVIRVVLKDNGIHTHSWRQYDVCPGGRMMARKQQLTMRRF
jgi:hypothetical protein